VQRQHRVLAVKRLVAVFSSTQNTAACAGGFTYSPMMSAVLRSKSGSLEAMLRSSRCGFNPCLAHMRATIICEIDSAEPSLRVLNTFRNFKLIKLPGKSCTFGVQLRQSVKDPALFLYELI
jgi:hypothetical protein